MSKSCSYQHSKCQFIYETYPNSKTSEKLVFKVKHRIFVSAWFNLFFAVALLQWYLPWEPTTFMFRGYKLGGLKSSFFMCFGVQGFIALWSLQSISELIENRGNLTSQSKRCGTAYTENEPIPALGLGEEVNKHYVRMFR